MAKPTKYASLICTIVTVVAAIGILIGLFTGNTLTIVILLLPAAIYEVYRTEGDSTRAASAILLAVLIAEIVLILFNINFNVAEFLGTSQKEIGGYLVPLGDLKIVGPSVMAVLAIILFVKTYGVYTRWLAVTIFVTSFAIIYSIDPGVFMDLFKYAIQEGINQI